MAELLLGPMVRYVNTTEATVWVETDAPCEVEILGRTARTFRVLDHYYALVIIGGLTPDSSTEYAVRLDGVVCWPQPVSGLPAPRLRTLPESGPLTLAFGSCCVTAPHEPPYTLSPDDDARGLGVDALYALTQRLREQDPGAWPQLLLLLGDQVYADELPPGTREFVRARRGPDGDPREEVGDFEEFAWLYREAWSPAAMRWLLSTIPSAMIFDDHDVTDDWNISASWVGEMRATGWWRGRITAALASYWIYQHLGNLSPSELNSGALYREVLAADDAWPVLHEFALRADREPGGRLWSYARRLAGTRLLVVDSREGRVLDDGRRQMIVDGAPGLSRRAEADLLDIGLVDVAAKQHDRRRRLAARSGGELPEERDQPVEGLLERRPVVRLSCTSRSSGSSSDRAVTIRAEEGIVALTRTGETVRFAALRRRIGPLWRSDRDDLPARRQERVWRTISPVKVLRRPSGRGSIRRFGAHASLRRPPPEVGTPPAAPSRAYVRGGPLHARGDIGRCRIRLCSGDLRDQVRGARPARHLETW